MKDMDITKNIKIIEQLKAQLLCDVSELYADMCDLSDERERSEILANIVIITYLLSNKLGVSYAALDSKISSCIKLGILNDKNPSWKSELMILSKYLSE